VFAIELFCAKDIPKRDNISMLQFFPYFQDVGRPLIRKTKALTTATAAKQTKLKINLFELPSSKETDIKRLDTYNPFQIIDTIGFYMSRLVAYCLMRKYARLVFDIHLLIVQWYQIVIVFDLRWQYFCN
jgi:hypothetical protein